MEHLSIFSPLDILLSQQHMLGILLLHIPKPINFSNHVLLQNHILVRHCLAMDWMSSQSCFKTTD